MVSGSCSRVQQPSASTARTVRPSARSLLPFISTIIACAFYPQVYVPCAPFHLSQMGPSHQNARLRCLSVLILSSPISAFPLS
ncbi:hypothetical protein BJX65DRAFT_251803 [Aspergillus insuetus]